MAVIPPLLPQAESLDQATSTEAGTIHISASETCETWVVMRQSQALGQDGDLARLGHRSRTAPPSIIGPPAPQPETRWVVIPADSPRHLTRSQVLDICATMGQDCDTQLQLNWQKYIRPASLCCMQGEEVRIDPTTRDI